MAESAAYVAIIAAIMAWIGAGLVWRGVRVVNGALRIFKAKPKPDAGSSTPERAVTGTRHWGAGR